MHTIPRQLPLLLLLTLLVIVGLSACSADQDGSQTPSRTEGPAEETATSPRTIQVTEATTAASTPTQEASLTGAVPNSLYVLAPSSATHTFGVGLAPR